MNTTEPTKEEIEALLSAINASMIYQGEGKEGDWTHDKWLVVFRRGLNSWAVDYKTGTGHRRKVLGRENQPKKPALLDVFYSLHMDGQALNENFDDWCDSFGYSSDSIKALNLYKGCLEHGRMLRKLFTSEQRAKLESFYSNY